MLEYIHQDSMIVHSPPTETSVTSHHPLQRKLGVATTLLDRAHKDKNNLSETAGCIYEISCKNCDYTYVSKTVRQLGTCIKEHRKEAEKISSKVQNKASRLMSVWDPRKSAI